MAPVADEAPAPMNLHQPINNNHPKLSCAIVPLNLGGHIIPMVDTGLLLAEHGIAVTVFASPGDVERLQPTVARARATSLPFDAEAISLPPGRVESADKATSATEALDTISSLALFAEPLRERLAPRAAAGPVFMLADAPCHWTISVARDLGIPRYMFHSMGCMAIQCNRLLQRYYAGGAADDWLAPFAVPGIPHRIELTRAQAPGIFPGDDLWRQVEESEATADGIVFNTVAAAEREYLDLYARELGKKVWAVGPVSLCHEGKPDRATVRGGSSSVEAASILNWLDSMKPKSVVYFGLGSVISFSLPQVEEIGAGLEASGRPFIFVIHVSVQEKHGKVEAWLSRFQERNKGRGLVIEGWAPQQVILSHPSIGGFVTHCGWNSVLEAIVSALPVATWPHFGDQFINERMLVDVLRIGVPMGVTQLHLWWESDKVGVRKERLADVIAELMGEGEEAKERRRKVETLMKKAKMAMMIDVGESRTALASFIEDAARLARQPKHGDIGSAIAAQTPQE